MDADLLRNLQDIETEILVTFDKYCSDKSINYSLAYGTLLGAVRHSGPIPWDDDVDVVMDRENYTKFITCYDSDPIDGFFLQKEGADTEFHINHMKLRKNGTVLASDEDLKVYQNNGIWIDIFVLDKLPKKQFVEYYIKFWNILRLVFTRDYAYNRGGVISFLSSSLLIKIPKKLRKKIRNVGEKKIKKYDCCCDNYDLICFASYDLSKIHYPSYLMDKFVRIRYDKYDLSVTFWYDECLRITYGDYMQPPLEEERICIHNPTHIKLQ